MKTYRILCCNFRIPADRRMQQSVYVQALQPSDAWAAFEALYPMKCFVSLHFEALA